MQDHDEITKKMLQYASSLETQDALLHAPARMKSEILEQSRKPEVQLAVYTNRFTRRIEFLLYSLRVGFAVTFALYMLVGCTRFVNPQTLSYESQHPPISSTLHQKSQELSSYLNQLTQSFFETEVLEK